MKPIDLAPNQPERFYRGGAAIAALRGGARPPEDRVPEDRVPEDRVPEDWVASTTTLFGESTAGLTRLPGGRLLRDAVAADPRGFLGEAHVERYGADPALLVKLLDAGQRLPVHCHPGREFARRHLDCPYGKTEAWIVAGVRGRHPTVHLGFRHPVDRATVGRWVADQQTDAMLAALNAFEVRPGDAVLVPAGVPHAIGAGVFVVELQEPTDLSVMLEWKGFPLDGSVDGHLGLGHEVALGCVDRSGWGADRLDRLRSRSPGTGQPGAGEPGAGEPDAGPPGVASLLPPDADPYFRAQRIRPPAEGTVSLPPSFAVLVVLAGAGVLRTEGGELPLRRGMTVLVPHGAGRSEIGGPLDLVRCLPPAAGAS